MGKNFAIGLILLLAVTVFYDAAWVQSHTATLYYFNPDSPQSNLSRLKRNMDEFLSKANFPINFQAFAHFVDFEQHLQGVPPAFLYIPEWYLKKNGERLNLRPILVPLHRGESSYRKILLATKHSKTNFTQADNITLAMTSMGPDGDSMLNTILFSPHGVSGAKINPIIVPKDSDALFALVLGQVDMALVTQKNLEKVTEISPNIIRTVRPLLESEPIPMPVICYVEGVASSENIKELKKLFVNGKAKRNRSIIMEMLQINEWQVVTN